MNARLGIKFITIAIISLIGLIVCGCQNDTPDNYELTAEFLGSDPAEGETIIIGTNLAIKIRLFFDRAPLSVTIFDQKAGLSGNSATWRGYIVKGLDNSTGRTTLPVAWVNPDGSKGAGKVITIYIRFDDGYGPLPVDTNLNDGEESHKNLDPDVLNRDGIVIECNKTIFTTDLVLALVGSIKESTLDVGESIRASIPLNWTRTVEDKTVRFERLNGSPLQFNKTYIIYGELGGEFKNRTPVFERFTTRLAPATKQ